MEGHVHPFVADVIKSFDTVESGILYCALGRLGLPGCFRKVYFPIMLMSDFGSSWPLGWVKLGLEMVAYHRDVP